MPLLGPSPTHVTFALRAATCIFFPLPVWLRAVILHFFYTALTYMETVHADGCVHGTEDPAVCMSPKRGVSPYFTEAPWIPGNGLVRGGQGCSPYCSGKPALFLLRGSVGSHSANPRQGRSNERRLLSGHISCNFSTSWVADMLYLY